MKIACTHPFQESVVTDTWKTRSWIKTINLTLIFLLHATFTLQFLAGSFLTRHHTLGTFWAGMKSVCKSSFPPTHNNNNKLHTPKTTFLISSRKPQSEGNLLPSETGAADGGHRRLQITGAEGRGQRPPQGPGCWRKTWTADDECRGLGEDTAEGQNFQGAPSHGGSHFCEFHP